MGGMGGSTRDPSAQAVITEKLYGVSEVDQCWRAGVPVTSIKVLPARRQIAAFVINPHFKSKKVGPAAEETSLP